MAMLVPCRCNNVNEELRTKIPVNADGNTKKKPTVINRAPKPFPLGHSKFGHFQAPWKRGLRQWEKFNLSVLCGYYIWYDGDRPFNSKRENAMRTLLTYIDNEQ